MEKSGYGTSGESIDSNSSDNMKKGSCVYFSVCMFLSALAGVFVLQFSSTSSISSSFRESVSLTSTKSDLSTARTETSTKPNFVLIVADDLGWNSLGYTDTDMAFASPTLTALASQGITMSNFYAQEVCSPSRASLLTGRYPLTSGMQYGMVAANVEWGQSFSQPLLLLLLLLMMGVMMCVVDDAFDGVDFRS